MAYDLQRSMADEREQRRQLSEIPRMIKPIDSGKWS
jgi:hypothetical protein